MINFVNRLNSHALLDILLRSNDATAIYTSEDLHIELVNDAMLNIWGKGPQVRGMRFEDALPEMAGQPFTELLKNVWRTGESYEAKDTRADLVVDGELRSFYFDFKYQAIHDETGATNCILHTATEVSDRIKAWEEVKARQQSEQQVIEELAAANEEYLATNEQLAQSLDQTLNLQYKLDQLIATSPVGMTILKGPKFTIELANPLIYQIWDRDEKVIGMELLKVFPELEGQPFPEMLRNVLNTGIPISLNEIAVVISDSEGKLNNIFVDFAYEPLKDTNGNVTAVMVTVKDISEIVKNREELVLAKLEQSKLIEELAASNEEYLSLNEELSALNEEYTAVNEELHTTNDELTAIREELELAVGQLKSANMVLNLENFAMSLAERKAMALFEDAPVAIGLLNGEDLMITTANAEILQLWGKTSDVVGHPLAEAIPELQGQAFLDLLRGVLQTGKAYYGTEEKVFLLRNGKMEICYFNFVYKPVKGYQDKAHSIMIVAYEVTTQVEARKELEENNERFQLALNAGKLGSYDLNVQTGSMTCSAQCKKNFGISEHDRFDLEDLLASISPEYKDYVQLQINTAITQNQMYNAEYEIRWPDGTRRWISASGRPNYDQDGNPTRMVGVTQDITERKAYEQRKDDFLGIASHELKTPITVLKANLQLLDRTKAQMGNAMAVKLIDNASRSMDKITSLIEDLLNISKHSEGKLELNKAVFDLSELLNSCCNHIRIEGKHELHISCDQPLPIFADEHRIEQVLVNFVNNAVKYAPDSKDIYLKATRHSHEVKVTVEDFGKGIPAEQIPHLFDRYWQANNTTENYSGLGLGLFICSEIIKRHGGDIGADSELAKGSTFWFTLPIVASELK